MNKIKYGLIASAICIVAGIFLAFFLQCKNPEKCAPGIEVYGNIELTEVEVSFKIPGKLEERLIEEGDLVQEGQLLGYLEKRELREKVSRNQARLAAAESDLQELQHGYLPQEIAQAASKLSEEQAELKRYEEDFERQKDLYERQVISQREFQASQTSLDVSKAQVKAAEEHLNLLQKGPRVEKIEQAKAKVRAEKVSLDITETQLGYADLYSPITGIVLTKVIEPGEYVSAGTPIVTVGDLSKVWLRAYINETDLGKIRLGQKVYVRTDSFPEKRYEGKISFISSEAEFTPKTIQTPKERVSLVYRIKIDLSNPNQELKPGMPAEAFIEINELK